MLGHVFEKLLDVDTREEQGTYYTPKEIVVYMCRRSLIDYLHKNLNIDKSFDLNDLFLEKFDFTIFKNYLSQIDELLKEVSICDPCVGSGAFPVTMMNEVSKLRYKLLEKKDNKEKQIYSFKKFFIQNNIYGVDIEPGAVEIAKLRLWLSLIVDVKDIKQIEALPNLDYKIMQGDSLIDEYYGINFENNENDLFGMDPELEKITKELQTKQNEYFNLKYLKSKVSKRKEVQVLLKKVLQYALDQQKSKLNFKKNTDLIKTVKNIEKNINELTKTYSIKEFFFWRLFFSNIFEKKNGFDIVIANPPYVFTKYVAWNKDYKKFLIEKYLNFNEKLSSGRIQTNKINLYVIFLILGLRLINDKGVNCFVVPNTILRSVIHHNFRHYLLKNSDILEIVDLKPKAFPGVTTSPIIILNNKQSLNSNSIKIIDTNFSEYKQITLDKTHNILQNNLKKNPFYVFNIFSNNEHLKVIKKIREDKIPLKNISKHIIAGIDASDKLIQNGKKNNQYRKLIRGSDVKKYRIEYNNEFILYDRDKMNRARPDELWRASKKIFIQRITGGNNPLVCSIDTNKLLGFASTNILLIHKEYENNYSYEFLSAILNSKLINYFYSVTFSNFSKLTVNISTSYLEEIPIPKINSRTSPIIKNIELTYKKEIKEKKNYNSKLIDKLIYDLYEIKKDDLKTINKQDE